MEEIIGLPVLSGFFLIALVLGAVISRTNFCTMGAVSDWVNIGDFGRLGAWFLAIVIAMLSLALMELLSLLSIDSTRPPYRSAIFAWPRYMLGGLMFGVGMTLAGGCVSRNLVRFGAGNIKSLVTLATAAIFAYLMTKTAFYEHGFHSWMEPLAIDLNDAGISSQDIGTIFSALIPVFDAGAVRMVLALLLAAMVVIFIKRTRGIAGNGANIAAGLIIGAAVAAGWYLTSGSIGDAWVEAAEWADSPPVSVGAQSFTFVNPLGEIISLIGNPANAGVLVTAGMLAAVGLVIGAFADAAISRQLHFSWFVSRQDFVANVVGGMLMGTGGVLALGCTVGQGVSGIATLALGSFITLIFIIFGCATTLKVQFYKMVYEDASWRDALFSGWVDMKLLPRSMRKLESV